MRKIGGLVLTLCLLHAVGGMAQTALTAPKRPSDDLQSTMHLGPVRILFGSEGVDFAPYLNQVTSTVRKNWYQLIPAEARPPQPTKGEVAIEFSITPDGQVVAMRLRTSSGNIQLDRAAWGAITASAPFAHLPERYAGPYLALRMYFCYNTEEQLDSASDSRNPLSEGPLIYPAATPQIATDGLQGNAPSVEVLSDTQGVEFAPYLQKVVRFVRRNWYQIIPDEARSTESKKGNVTLQFYIMRDGNVAGVQLHTPSGEAALDRAAWGAITTSSPFAPLPEEFHGRYLALRMRFYYNPTKSDLQSGAINTQ